MNVKRPSAPKDVDAVTRAHMVSAFAWLIPAFTILGFATVGASRFLLGLSLLQSWLAGLSVMIGGPAFFYFVLYETVIDRTASFVGSIYGGSRMPAQRIPAYSRAQALASKGAYSDALAVLEAEVFEDPGNPGPYLAAAAICLQEMGDARSAADWYRRARTAERITTETSAYVCIRLSEIYEANGEPGRAAVELRRLIELYPESQYQEYARGRLGQLKSDASAASASKEAGERPPQSVG